MNRNGWFAFAVSCINGMKRSALDWSERERAIACKFVDDNDDDDDNDGAEPTKYV